MSLLAPVLGGIGSIFGSIEQNNQSKAMQAFVNQLYQQQQGIDNKVQQGVGTLNNEANLYNAPLSQLSQAMGGEAGVANQMAPNALSQYAQDALSPAALAHLTGVNAGGLTGNALAYLSHPGQTNLAATTPGTSSFYANELANGLNPQTQQNAQNQLQQQYQQSQNAIRANATPGQNLSSMQQAAQNNLLTNSANLSGQLAGENQQVQAQGAQGLQNNALGLDSQTMQMLLGAAQLGTNYNQTVLGNQAAGSSALQQALSQLQGFTGQGAQLGEFGTSTLASLGSQLGQEGEAYTGLASNAASSAAQNNPFSSLGSILAQYPNLFSPKQPQAGVTVGSNGWAQAGIGPNTVADSNTLAMPSIGGIGGGIGGGSYG
jgi:hypothetical protein